MKTPKVLRISSADPAQVMAICATIRAHPEATHVLVLRGEYSPEGLQYIADTLDEDDCAFPKTMIFCIGEDDDLAWVPRDRVAAAVAPPDAWAPLRAFVAAASEHAFDGLGVETETVASGIAIGRSLAFDAVLAEMDRMDASGEYDYQPLDGDPDDL